jgi:hypothetical protein
VVKHIMKVVSNDGDGELYVKLSDICACDICAWLTAGGIPKAAQILAEYLEAEQKQSLTDA